MHGTYPYHSTPLGPRHSKAIPPHPLALGVHPTAHPANSPSQVALIVDQRVALHDRAAGGMDVNPLVDSEAGRKARSWKNVRYEWEHERGKLAAERELEEKLAQAANSPGGYFPLDGGQDCPALMQQQSSSTSSSHLLATIDEGAYGSGGSPARPALVSKGNGQPPPSTPTPGSKKSSAASRVRVFQA